MSYWAPEMLEYINGIEWPASKEDLISYAEISGAPAHFLDLLERELVDDVMYDYDYFDEDFVSSDDYSDYDEEEYD